MSDWQVELVEDNISEFHVHFKGPPDSKRRSPALPTPTAGHLLATVPKGLHLQPLHHL
jgi:hypothetical protein